MKSVIATGTVSVFVTIFLIYLPSLTGSGSDSTKSLVKDLSGGGKCASNDGCGFGHCDLSVGTCVCDPRATGPNCDELMKSQLGALVVCGAGGCMSGVHHYWLGDKLSFGFQFGFFIFAIAGYSFMVEAAKTGEDSGCAILCGIPSIGILIGLLLYSIVVGLMLIDNSGQGPWPELYPM